MSTAAENSNPVDVDDATTPTTAEETPEEDESALQSYNPSISDGLHDEDLEKMKGDAIGSTLYSERFVLSTLLKLQKIEKDLSEDEAFEKDLCNLWDMTIEKDVVKLLLKHKVLELFVGVITETEDKRLTEILIGIIGNMSNLSEVRDVICRSHEIMTPLVNLVSCSDSLTLIQLMRFFHTGLVFENNENELIWFQHFRYSEDFVANFSFILKNSINSTLLFNALEALNAICAKFAVIEEPGFPEMFVKSNLIESVMEAFKTLIPTIAESEPKDDTATPTQNSQKIMSVFLDIHVTLSQYDDLSRDVYEPLIGQLVICISQILSPLCKPIFLLPLTYNEQEVIENINELFQAIGDPFEEICYAQMITIWKLIDADRVTKDANPNAFEDEDEGVDEVSAEDLCMTIMEFLTRTVLNSEGDGLPNALRMHTRRTILKLLSALRAGNFDEDNSQSRMMITQALKKLQDEQDAVN